MNEPRSGQNEITTSALVAPLAAHGRWRSPSIQATWRRAVLLFVGALVLVVGATLGFTRAERTLVDAAARRSQDRLETIAVLQQEISRVDKLLGVILYEIQGGVTVREALSEWEVATAAIGRGLERLEADGDRPQRGDIAELRRLWASVDESVERAQGMWGTGDAMKALGAGNDPFAATWTDRALAQQMLASLGVEAVGRFDELTQQAEARQAVLERSFAVAVVFMIALGAFTARRVSRRVVRPLLALREVMIRVRDGALAEKITVPAAAGRELVDLALAANEMLARLQFAQGRLYDQAYTDSLTGLFNRRAFSDFLERAAAPDLNGRAAVMLLDIDDFKIVNDSMGHSAGDQLLVAVSRRLKGAAREGDLVARFGGDEFAIIVQGDDAIGAATTIAERILRAFQDDVVIAGQSLRVTASIGIADGLGAGSVDDLLAHADSAMYVAKGRGKACFEVFDPILHATMLVRSETKMQLRQATGDDQLVLHYQPVVDLNSGDTVGFEALVRWMHPERGLLMPGDFIPAAEESGDIVGIGEWVLDRACRDLAHWQQTTDSQVWMSVNISSRQVMSGTLLDTVHDTLTRYQIDADSLVLELTEATTFADSTSYVTTLQALRSLGVRVAIDDFGTGFSSLRYLTQLPVDIIKIDRSFVSQSGDDGNGDVMLSGIVKITRDLGFEVIAEGIEDHDEMHRLGALGGLSGQGYYIARPMPAEDAVGHLSAALGQYGISVAGSDVLADRFNEDGVPAEA